MLVAIFLFICLCTYFNRIFPEKMKNFNEGFSGLIRRSSIIGRMNIFKIGERLSPFVAVAGIGLTINNLFFRK